MSAVPDPPDDENGGIPTGHIDSVSGARRPWLGALVWLVVCLVYAGLELAGLIDGLLFPAPLIAALAIARALEWGGAGAVPRPVGRSIALVVAVGCFPLAIAVWRLRIGVEEIPSSRLALALAAAGLLGTACLCRPFRARLLRPVGLDPESAVHTVSAIAFVLALLLAAGDFIELQGDTGDTGGTVPLYPTDSLMAFLGDVTPALAGVGFLLTRGLRATRARLDLRPISLRLFGWAVVAALLFHVGVGLLEYAERFLLPTVYELEDRFRYEFVNIPPLVGALLDSLAAGTGEELLFRGALQPRVGVVLTALLFASTHAQYQVPGVIVIFLIGLALGFLKQRTSTTFTVCVHVLYDLGAFLLPGF